MEKCFEEILDIALQNQCTDIHFVIRNKEIEILFRGIHGLKQYPIDFLDEKLFNYLMYQSRLDITSKIPQSGSFTYYYKGHYYDFRFAVIVMNQLKSGVLRILNCHNGLTLEQLTFQKEVQRKLLETIKKTSGLVLFSGPTGSGKTTTMYSILKLIKGRTIYSLEDPIEVVQDNIIQLEINQKKGFGFDEGIRQILRHNPDVLMIGEIRDEITAKMTIRAALTGALVIASVHAPSTIATLHRLMDLGCDKNDLLNICEIIFNQRLVKLKKKQQYTCIFDYLEQSDISGYLNGENVKSKMDSKIKEAIEKEIISDEIY